MDVQGLDEAARLLGGAVLGPTELAAALGWDPISVLGREDRARVGRLPFGRAELERARADGEILVLRVPRGPDGPLTMTALATHLAGGLDPKAHQGVGYLLRDEWTIDDQPFATE